MLDLESIQKRCEAARQDSDKEDTGMIVDVCGFHPDTCSKENEDRWYVEGQFHMTKGEAEADARLINQDIPALISEIRRLRGELELCQDCNCPETDCAHKLDTPQEGS